MSRIISLTGSSWNHSELGIVTPDPFFHIGIADTITPEWQLQQKTAERFGSLGFLNLFHFQEKYRHALRPDILEAILAAVSPSSIVIMLDVFDVLFNNSLFSIYSLFLEVESQTPPDSYGRKPSILFNGEKNCWPDTSVSSQYPDHDLATPNPFLNAGVMVGRCQSILDIVRKKSTTALDHDAEVWKKVSDDDQRYWTHAYLSSREDGSLPRIEVDHYCRLACCAFGQTNDTFAANNGIVFIKQTGVRPCLLHFNGPSKNAMKGVADQLGYQGILP
jgi:hypothetical protein